MNMHNALTTFFVVRKYYTLAHTSETFGAAAMNTAPPPRTSAGVSALTAELMPPARTDIQTRADIERLVATFYQHVRVDALLGSIFDDVVRIDWATHLPRMYDFWETVLLHVPRYKGNPVTKHVDVAHKTPLTEVHFDRWMTLWRQTGQDLFDGPVATAAQERAQVMGAVMLYKCTHAHSLPLLDDCSYRQAAAAHSYNRSSSTEDA